jgi:hypothetical protein
LAPRSARAPDIEPANVPSGEITFTKSDIAQAPTKVRSMDHIGLDAQNINAFVGKL